MPAEQAPTDLRPGALRLALAAALGAVIVFVLLVASLYAFGAYDKRDGPRSRRIELLSDSERFDLAELLGEAPKNERPRLPELADIPALALPSAPLSGFVQVEVVIDGQGRVAEAEVVGATHAGAFEKQALAIVRARRYTPRPDGGLDHRTEIIDYTIANNEPVSDDARGD